MYQHGQCTVGAAKRLPPSSRRHRAPAILMRWLASCPPRWCLEVTNVSTASCISQEKRGSWPRSSDSEIPSYFLASVRSGPSACAIFRSTTGCARVPKRIVGRTAAHGPFRSPGDLVRCTHRCRVTRGARTRGGDREDAERASVRPDTDTGQRWRFFERLLAIAIARFCMEGRESPTMV